MSDDQTQNKKAPGGTGAKVFAVFYVYDGLGQKVRETSFSGSAKEILEAQAEYFKPFLPTSEQEGQ